MEELQSDPCARNAFAALVRGLLFLGYLSNAGSYLPELCKRRRAPINADIRTIAPQRL